MITADTSSGIAFLEGARGNDVDLLDKALEDRQLLMVPIVLAELLSDPNLSTNVSKALMGVPLIEIEDGIWRRAGVLRAKVLSKRRTARLGDALIAQICIDRRIGLITRDRDFHAFTEAADLSIV